MTDYKRDEDAIRREHGLIPCDCDVEGGAANCGEHGPYRQSSLQAERWSEDAKGLLMGANNSTCDYADCSGHAKWLLHGDARCDTHRWIADGGRDIRG